MMWLSEVFDCIKVIVVCCKTWSIGCLAAFSQAIEDEGGDPDNIEIPISADTPTRKGAKPKGEKLTWPSVDNTSMNYRGRC